MPKPSLPAGPRTLGRGSKRVAMTGRCSGVGLEVLHGVVTDIVPAPDRPDGFDAHSSAPPRWIVVHPPPPSGATTSCARATASLVRSGSAASARTHASDSATR